MSEAVHKWAHNFEDRVVAAAVKLGFSKLAEFLASVPGVPYCIAAHRLGGFPPIQVVVAQFREARQCGTVREAAQDSLVREIAEFLPNGWGIATNTEFQRARALASWSSSVKVTGRCEACAPQVRAISDALWSLSIPIEWKPSGPNDPIIESLFEQHWKCEPSPPSL